MYFGSVSEKHEVHIRTSFNNFALSAALFLNLKNLWGGLFIQNTRHCKHLTVNSLMVD